MRPDLLKPWRVGAPYTSRGTGFHIGERRLITNAHVVRHHTSLRLTRHGQPGNFAGRVLCESEMCDLALVTVDDDDFWNDGIGSTLDDIFNITESMAEYEAELEAEKEDVHEYVKGQAMNIGEEA